MDREDAEPPLAYTVEQIAQLLQVSPRACYDAIRRGQIPAIRIGRSIRIPRVALEAWLVEATRRVTDIPPPPFLARHPALRARLAHAREFGLLHQRRTGAEND